MHHFRKKSSSSKSPANTPPPTPTPPIFESIDRGIATLHPRAKDRRALAALTGAVALSILSPSCDPTDVAPHESGSSKESLWKAAYGAARTAVDIAKDTTDMHPPLKAVMVALSVLIKNYDQTTANADRIREVEERVQSLGGIFTYPVGDQDSEEKARREIFRKKLVGIITKLGPLAEQHGLMKFLINVDHANTLNGFVTELANAITDYQISLQQSTHENTNRIDKATSNIDKTANKIIEAVDLELLGKLEPVRNAGHQAGNHDTCLRGTRESVLDEIMQWAKDPQERQVFWLNGLAGTGKSTIAQTFSDMAAKTGILGASFFCSRDYLSRRELKNIFPTLAYQLACRYPAFRSQMIQVIKKDPSIAQHSLISQLMDLIVDPMSSTKISCVIVIDALDECVDDQPASAILSVLGRHVKELSFAKFFITGRPEPRIRSGFRLPLLEPLTQIFLLHQVKPSDVDEDIQLYLQEKLTAVAKQRSDFDVSDPWPCDQDLVALTKKSAGLFIFATTLTKFIESEHHEPNERLQLIVTSSDTVYEGRAGIDPLYNQVLTLAFSDITEDTVFASLRRVLGAVVLAFNPLSREQIAKMLGITPSLIATTLRHLHSVLLVPNEDSGEIRVFHKSFPDFLQDPDRCSDSKFFIDPPHHHGDIALDCLELLKKLKPNPCDLPDFVMNRDVPDLPELLEEKVGGAMRYACGYWAMHTGSSPTTDDYVNRLIPSATEFFENNAVPWIEVMSLENRLDSVIYSVYHLLDWLGTVNVSVSTLRKLVQDCLRFTMHFFLPIQQSASHIYHSAIPLSPMSSTFHSRSLHQNTKVEMFYGRPDAWGIVVRSITSSSKHFTSMATFGHKIAAACDDGTVGIYDSITGVLRLSLRLTDPVQAMVGSPDGSVLFCAHNMPSITVWDMQTGGLIHTLVLTRNARDIALSVKGRYLACGLDGGSVEVWKFARRIGGGSIWASSPVTQFCWLEPEERLVVSTGRLVRIWDIVTSTILHSYTTEYPARHMAYSQKFNQLAIVARSAPDSTVTTIDLQTDTATTSPWTPKNTYCTFSQTAEELMCGMETHGLQLFNVSERRFKHIEYPDTVTSVSPLQNGTVVVNSAGSGIQLLSLDEGHTPSQQPTISALTVRSVDHGRIIAVVPTSRDHMIFLDLATMSQLSKIPVQNTDRIPNDHTTLVCASHKSLEAVYYFREGGRGFLRLWNLYEEDPRWTVKVDGVPKIGDISPTATMLVTLHDINNKSYLYVWDAQNGQGNAHRYTIDSPLLDIKFTSDTKLDLYFLNDLQICAILSEELGLTLKPTHSFQLAQKRRYLGVDDTHEWIISDSKRICWIPPGYIGSTQSSYCWAGSSLVMVGQDGMLRKLTFSDKHWIGR